MATLIVEFIFANFTEHDAIFSTPRARALECHQMRLSILISNVLLFECFLGVAWRLFRIKKAERKS